MKCASLNKMKELLTIITTEQPRKKLADEHIRSWRTYDESVAVAANMLGCNVRNLTNIAGLNNKNVAQRKN